MSLYSDEVKKMVRSYEWPKNLMLDVQDGFDEISHSEFLWIVLYRDNFITIDGVDQLRVSKMINDLIPRLIMAGVPTRLIVKPGVRFNG